MSLGVSVVAVLAVFGPSTDRLHTRISKSVTFPVSVVVLSSLVLLSHFSLPCREDLWHRNETVLCLRQFTQDIPYHEIPFTPEV